MFWIGVCVLLLALFGLSFYLELIVEKIDSDMAFPVTSLVVAIFTIVVTLCFLNFGPGVREEYNDLVVEKSCIEQQAAGLRYTYRDVTKDFVKNATDFNKKLMEKQFTVKEWGNFWNFHSKEILNIEPIDVEGLLEKSGVSEYNNFKDNK